MRNRFRIHPTDSVVFIWLMCVAVFFVGYVYNISKLLSMDIYNPTILLGVRVIGLIIPPVGMIVGYV